MLQPPQKALEFLTPRLNGSSHPESEHERREILSPKHPGGRPTKYDPGYCAQMVAFCRQGYSLTGFAGSIGVCRDTISEWGKVHPEFSAAIKQAKAAWALFWEERNVEIGRNGGAKGQATIVILTSRMHPPRTSLTGDS